MRPLALAFALVIWPALGLAQQPKVRTLSEQEMIDMMQGSSIQASRSSNTATMVQRVKDAMARGVRFTMIRLEDVPDDWMVANLVGVGGGGAWEYVRERTQKQNLPTIQNAPARAVDALGKHIGRKIDAVIRFEPAGQTLNTFLAAAELGVPVVDGCLAGLEDAIAVGERRGVRIRRQRRREDAPEALAEDASVTPVLAPAAPGDDEVSGAVGSDGV